MAKTIIVVPTYNEAENIENLIEQLESLDGDFGIVVVDDNSPDGTAQMVEEMGRRWGNIEVHRRPGKLGIGSAIREGMAKALSYPDCQYVITMDADLSHNPQDIPKLLTAAEAGDAGMIQGSRYIKGGGIIGWNFIRKLQSRVANTLCGLLFGLPREVTTYFRAYTRESAQVAVDEALADKYEFAVRSALAVKDHGIKITEVPIVFVNRTQGKSKLKPLDVVVWFFVIIRLFIPRLLCRPGSGRLLKFCMVGLTGLGVDNGILWLLTEQAGLFYIISAVIATEVAIITNFILNDNWTFRDRKKLGSKLITRLLKYNITYAIGVGVKLGMLTLLTEVFGLYYIISNIIGIVTVFLWNYGGSTLWAWRVKR